MKTQQNKLYDLYADGVKIGSCLLKEEVREIKNEYIKYYNEMGRKPHFKTVEV